MCCSLLAWAQNTVTGTVLDESNLEVIGANVKEKGTANGAITDMNGVFHLKVSNLQKAVLQISFMGYEPQEVPLNGRKQLKIILKETANELQEVTVVAYGTNAKPEYIDIRKVSEGILTNLIPQLIKAGEKIGTVILEDGKEEPIIAEEDITIEAGTPVAVKMYARRGIIDERTPLFR